MPRTRSSYRKRRVQSKHLSMDTEESRTSRSLENVTSNVGKSPWISRQAQRGPKWNLSEDGGQVRCKKKHRHQISKPVHIVCKIWACQGASVRGTSRIAAQTRASSENWSLLWFFNFLFLIWLQKHMALFLLFYYLCSPDIFLNFRLATNLRLSMSRKKRRHCAAVPDVLADRRKLCVCARFVCCLF